jgi:hypothetical protein
MAGSPTPAPTLSANLNGGTGDDLADSADPAGDNEYDENGGRGAYDENSSDEIKESSMGSAMVWAAPLAAVSVVAAALVAFCWSRKAQEKGGKERNRDIASLLIERDGEHSESTDETSEGIPSEIPMHHPANRRAGSKV